jgi:hypothetical protein
MRKLYTFLLIFFTAQKLFSTETTNITPELATLNNLIEITQKNVEIQESIRQQLVNYQKVNKEFLKHPDDKELLYQTIILADRLFEKINNAHITQSFSPEFLKELKLFSQIAQNQGGRKP